MSASTASSLKRLSTVSTLVDAAITFARGGRKSAIALVVAAALSKRVPGFGTAVSLALRAARRLR